MRLSKAAVGVILAGLGWSAPVSASVYGDDLSRCLVKAATETDRTTFVRWIFSALSSSPKVTSLATVSAEQRQAYHKQAAQLMERLISVDCRKEAVEAMKYDGIGTLRSSFELLGQVATTDLMADPVVTREMEAFAGFLDQKKWEALGAEAGLPTASGTAAKSKD